MEFRWNSAMCAFLLAGILSNGQANSDGIHTKRFEPPRRTAKDVLILPLYLPEYLLRLISLPIQYGVVAAERHHLSERVVEFLSNDDRTIWLLPIITLGTNDGFGAGMRFTHKGLDRKRVRLDLSAQLFVNRDFFTEARLRTTPLSSRRLFYDFAFKAQRDENVRYFGIGNETPKEDKSLYRKDLMSFTAEAGLQSIYRTPIRASLLMGYLFSKALATSRDGSPTIDQVYRVSELPGLGKNLQYLLTGLRIQYDTRSSLSFPASGELLETRVEVASTFQAQNTGFNKLIVDGAKSFDLYRGANVLVAGMRFESTAGNNGMVPFYFLSELDWESPLRGFPDGRFRDKYAAVTNLEYRYKVWESYLSSRTVLATGVFFDFGRVFAEIKDIVRGPYHYSVGGGFALFTPDSFLMTAQFGYGGEGIQLLFRSGWPL